MPQGATPRSLTIHLRGPLTRSCKPGDSVTVAGVFLPQPYTGFRAMRAGLLTTTFLEAMSVSQDKRSYKDAAADDTLHAQIEVRSSPALHNLPSGSAAHLALPWSIIDAVPSNS